MAVKLKELPGPKGAPVVGNMFRLDLPGLHNQLEDWIEEYGDVFHLNLGLVQYMVVSRPSLLQKILAARPDGFKRSQKLIDVIRDGGVYGVFNAEGEDWQLHRKMVAKGLDVKHQKDFYPAILPPLERLYDKWSRLAESGEAFDVQKDLLRFTVDVTTSLAFGYPMNTLEQEGEVIQDRMEKIFPMIFKRINMPVPWYKLYRSRADKEFEEAVKAMNVLVDEFIEAGKQRIAKNPELRTKPSNVLEAILVAAEEDDRFTNETVRGNLLTLLMAGEDTTAHSLAWSIYQLTQHPNVARRVGEEANGILGGAPVAREYEQNAKMKYIEATAFESMRFKPVAPIMLFEVIEPTELEGYEFVKGQKVLTHHRFGAKSDIFFTDAKRFNPERWLKSSECPVHDAQAFTPFGGGPRYCPGRNLALLEMRMVLSMLYKNFEVELLTPYDKVDEILAFTMSSSPFFIRLHKKSV